VRRRGRGLARANAGGKRHLRAEGRVERVAADAVGVVVVVAADAVT
jgi:hypothetical protein